MSDNLVTNYGWSGTSGPHSCDYLAPQVLALLDKLGCERVVDIGAGNGALCALLSDSGKNAVGVEYDQAGVRLARQTYPSIPFYQLGVQDDPTPLLESEGTFDAAVSTEVVEHLFSPHLLPQFAAKTLKDNGVLIISTPYHGYLKNFVLSLLNKWDGHHTALWHGGHIKFWSRNTLTQLLEGNGFSVTDFKGAGRAPWLWKSMILVARKNPTTQTDDCGSP